jgi:Transglycosylase SLT domain
MADDLEKFVLQYTVEMKDAITRLEKLNQSVERVNKGSAKAGKEFRMFARGATAELDKLVPGVSKVGEAVRLMSVEFGVAALAVAALGAGIKTVLDLRERFNAQRSTGMNIGVSELRMEDLERKFATQSGGFVGREQLRGSLGGLSNFVNSAYTDPMQWNKQARYLRMLGISPGDRGKGAPPIMDMLQNLGTRFQGMSTSDVQGAAKAMGLDQDFAKTLSKLGGSVGTPGLTVEEIKQRQETNAQILKLDDNMGKLKESFTETGDVIAANLLPGVNALLGVFKDVGFSPEEAAKRVKDNRREQEVRDDAAKRYEAMRSARTGGGGFFSKLFASGSADDMARARMEAEVAYGTRHPNVHLRDQGAHVQTAAELIKAADKVNEDGVKTATNMELAVNMFAGAVTSFAGSVDEKQAWAAWAGEIGKAAGLGSGAGGTPAQPGMSSKAGAPSPYDSLFEEAGRKTGISAATLKAVSFVESKFNPGAVSDQGAVGLMQVKPENFKSLGITDPRDPRQNIMGGSELLRQYLQMAGGDMDTALMLYHGGPNRRGWGPKTRAYPGLVSAAGGGNAAQPMGPGGTSGSHLGKPGVRETTVLNNLSSWLGVPKEQLLMGGINRGDVNFALQKGENDMTRNIAQLTMKQNQPYLPANELSNIRYQLQQQTMFLEWVKTYGPQIAEASPEGPATRSEGMRTMNLTFNGSQMTPGDMVTVVKGHMTSLFGDTVNYNTSSMVK